MPLSNGIDCGIEYEDGRESITVDTVTLETFYSIYSINGDSVWHYEAVYDGFYTCDKSSHLQKSSSVVGDIIIVGDICVWRFGAEANLTLHKKYSGPLPPESWGEEVIE